MFYKKILFLALLAPLLSSGYAQASYTYNSSDVIKYALTSHGISYVLRNRSNSVNAWEVADNLSNYNVKSQRWGNTDCSGLVSAAIRYHRYYEPNARSKRALSTALFDSYAASGRDNLAFVGNRGDDMSRLVQHGDMLNRSGSPYGHVFLYNGHNSRGQLEAVEARCTRCGVGRFTYTWNDVASSGYRIIRPTNIHNDVSNRNRVFGLSEAEAVHRVRSANASSTPQQRNTVANSECTYRVNSGDNAQLILQGTRTNNFNQLQQMNPEVDFQRLRVGQRLNARCG